MSDTRDWLTDWLTGWPRWAPDLGVGLLVLLIGLVNVSHQHPDLNTSRLSLVLVVLGLATAAGLSRLAPGAALALVWVTCAFQLFANVSLLFVQVTIAVVAFGTARWGSRPTVVASGLSIPAAAAVLLFLIVGGGYFDLIDDPASLQLLREFNRFSSTWEVAAAAVGMGVLGAPWLAGLAVRFGTRARDSQASAAIAEADAERAQRESAQAHEIARLQEEQTALARDVHDVVGHSLAVILAQAESGQFHDDRDELKRTLATIATSARTSLRDVRAVLAAPGTGGQPVGQGGFDDLVEGVRRSGHEVRSAEWGDPRPLPPELETVAYRVLQEMLTNAVKHGRRHAAIEVERHWPERGTVQPSWPAELRVEVRNVIDDPGALGETQPINRVPINRLPVGAGPPGEGQAGEGQAGEGQGLVGMRRRLEAVGGRLDVRRRESADGASFTATAWVPVRVSG